MSNKIDSPRMVIKLSLFGIVGLFLLQTPVQLQDKNAEYAGQASGDLVNSVDGAVRTAGLTTSTPEPYFSVTWTAEANSAADITDPGGYTSVMRRHIVMAGTAIVRRLDDRPSPIGLQDNFPLDLTVTDDYDRVETFPSACNGNDIVKRHQYFSIGDSGRYKGPEQGLHIDPIDLGDGVKYIIDPFQNSSSRFAIYDHPFRYDRYLDITRCDGNTTSTFFSGDGDDYIVPLGNPSPDYLMQGDSEGKIFKVSREFSAPIDPTPTTTVKWTLMAQRLLDLDLTVDRLEVTQAIQDKANSIPLVQGRSTVVRAFLGVGKNQAPYPLVTGRLTGYSGSTELGSVKPFNPGGRITALPQPDWKQIDHTLNFELPIAWTEQPSLRLEVEVNDDRSLFETNYENNKLSAPVTTRACQGISIAYLPVHYTPPEGFTPTDPSGNISIGQEFMRKVYPIPDKELKYFPRPGLTWPKSVSTEAGANELVDALTQQLLSGSGSGSTHVYGWTPTLASPSNGLGDRPGLGAFGNDTENPNRWRRTFAHEVGHNFGLGHSATAGTDGRHWFDVYERKIKPAGGDLYDIMVPAKNESEAWISPSSYLFLMSKMCGAGAAPIGQSKPETPAVIDNLIVAGTLNNGPTITGTLGPLYRTITAPTFVLPADTTYCVKLKNAAGAVLSQYCFSIGFDGDNVTPVTARSFGMVVPYPVGLNRVELTYGTTVLSSRTASSNPPAVQVTFPNAPGLSLTGVQNITWTASDPDSDPLTYKVLYSRDNGATWLGVGSGIVGNSYPFDFSSLPGGTGGLVKVMVSDGFRSAEDVSDNPFSIANKPPVAAIVSPPTGMSFPANTKIRLEATGSDLEDGSLGDAAFSWSSDRDGALGTGQVLETNLSIGTHTITLIARDSSGLTNTAIITCTAVSTSPVVVVSGKVLTPDGRGLKNANVSITDSIGLRRTVTTNSFGLYRFDEVKTGGTYTIGVSSKRYRFASRTLQVIDTLSNVDFVGQE